MCIAYCIPFNFMQYAMFPFDTFDSLLQSIRIIFRNFDITDAHDRKMVVLQVATFIYIKCKSFLVHCRIDY